MWYIQNTKQTSSDGSFHGIIVAYQIQVNYTLIKYKICRRPKMNVNYLYITFN